MLIMTNPNEFSDGDVIDVYGKSGVADACYHYIGKIERSVIGYYSYKLGTEGEWVRTTEITAEGGVDRLLHAHLRGLAKPVSDAPRQSSYLPVSL